MKRKLLLSSLTLNDNIERKVCEYIFNIIDYKFVHGVTMVSMFNK